MSAKRRTLADMMPDTIDAPTAIETPQAVSKRQPDVVPVNFFVAPEDRKRLRQLSLDTGTSLQKLCHEGLNAMLQSRGLAPLKPVTANVPNARTRRNLA